jgi:hypothetical protein
MSDDVPPVLAYRTDEIGLGLLLLWLRETPGATLGDATATGILEGWLTLLGDTPGAVPDPEDAYLEVTQLRARARELEAEVARLRASLQTEREVNRLHCEAQNDLEDRAERLLRENLTLQDALRALVAVEPTLHVPQDYEDCVYCPASKPVCGPRWNDPFVHDPECPWLRAKALLGEEGA